MPDRKITIPILMQPCLTPEWERQIDQEPDHRPFGSLNQKECYFGPNGRWLLSAILSNLDLNREDEVAILTTSDETYVSTCVSVTAFNFGKISRVITRQTKVVIIIHEFGFVYPGIGALADELRSKGIVVIEDCAHIIGYEVNGKKIGSFGDYSIFSLPKIIPAPCGGMLIAAPGFHVPRMNPREAVMAESAIRFSDKYLPKYQLFNRLKMERYTILRTLERKFSLQVPSDQAVPFMMGFFTEKKAELEQEITGVEWGATLRSDLVYIPTNPLAPVEHFQSLVESIIGFDG